MAARDSAFVVQLLTAEGHALPWAHRDCKVVDERSEDWREALQHENLLLGDLSLSPATNNDAFSQGILGWNRQRRWLRACAAVERGSTIAMTSSVAFGFLTWNAEN